MIVGQLLGSAVGEYLGSSIGNENTKVISTIIGSIAGYLIGDKIMNFLDKEQQAELENSIQKTLDKNSVNNSILWKSKKSEYTSVLITPTRDFNANNNEFRGYQKMITRNNDQVLENSKVCRDENGNWIKLDT